MPIRPELRIYYRAAWRAQRRETIAILGSACIVCGVEHPRINLAHTNHDPRNGSLVALMCPTCHATHDAPQRYAMTRRTRARRHGQLWLLPEIEWAPFAGWMIPKRVLEEQQGRLEL